MDNHTAQTRVFIDTIYSSTFQSLYDAEAHISELIMTYPEAGRILMSPTPQAAERGHAASEMSEAMQVIDPELRERVRWLGTAMLDFFEHIWTQSQKGPFPTSDRCETAGKSKAWIIAALPSEQLPSPSSREEARELSRLAPLDILTALVCADTILQRVYQLFCRKCLVNQHVTFTCTYWVWYRPGGSEEKA